MEIRTVEDGDAKQIVDIYNSEVLNSTVTLDIRPRTPEQQLAWIGHHVGIHQALVAVEGNRVLGYASLSPYRMKAGYSGTVEDSIYLHSNYRGRGVGKQLLTALMETAQKSGFHTCMARIVASNRASFELHRSCNFELVGIEREVGRKFGRWLDVTLMQRMLR